MQTVNESKKQEEEVEEAESIVSIQQEQERETYTVRWKKQEEDGPLWEDPLPQEDLLSPQELRPEVLRISRSHTVLLVQIFHFHRLCSEYILQEER